MNPQAAMIKTLLRTLVLLPISVAVYSLILKAVYVDVIVVQFGYVGYSFDPPSWDTSVLAWISATAAGVFLPRRAIGPSSVVLWVLYVVVVAPTVLALPYIGTMSASAGLGFGGGLSAGFVCASLIVRRRIEPKRLGFGLSSTTFWMIVGLFSLATYTYLAISTGLSLQFISILDVYDQRADYREALASASLLGYFVSNQANVVNPLVIAWAIQRRKWWLIVLVIIGQLVLFSATGFKTVLFSILAISVLLILFRVSPKPRLLILMWGSAGLVVVSWIVDNLIGSVLLTSLFSRRFIFTPARLSGLYFDWYSNNPLSLMANSILSPFIDTSYEYGPARTIAIYATGSADASLNANVFAAGYAEFAWYGVIGVAVLLGLYLRVLDRVAAGLPVWLVSVVTVMPSITLSNTALHTALLSHGLLAAVVLLAIVPRSQSESPVSFGVAGLGAAGRVEPTRVSGGFISGSSRSRV